ncbi:MAG: rRNA maturation RNase YbeY [Clostridia bacterium]|nr:rRNA maturation RNase YbeY [Clostridia bacterium]MBP3300655.1 rRNA maturation RNase YbeY [Clostridia bacterium]
MSHCYVSITNQQRKERTPKALKDLIRSVVNAVLDYEGVTAECEMSVLLVDDKKIWELNRTFRDVDRPTDVLSFPSGEYPAENGTEFIYVGDMALSLERARKQAREYGHTYEREVAFLTAHSVLHCLGYDHVDGPEQEKEMFSRQEAILQGMGLHR